MKRMIAVSSFGLAYAYASACCGVSPNGQPVTFGDQSNIIVWNAETKTEHFVRNAYFDSTAKDFGFIAATPSVPELKEAEKGAFGFLERQKPKPFKFSCSSEVATRGGPSATSTVETLQQVEVGEYLATTVRSSDAKAMSSYLKQNGYASNSDTDEWIGFYTKKKWVFTAFKVRDGGDGKSATGVIRMSFRTDEPFNPYYVPASNSHGSHGTLKLYFVSDGTYSASVGHGSNWIPALWNNQFEVYDIRTIADHLNLPHSEFSKNMTITYFEKANWLDGSKDDLYFKKDSPLSTIIMVLLAGLGGGLWWFTKSRRVKVLSPSQ